MINLWVIPDECRKIRKHNDVSPTAKLADPLPKTWQWDSIVARPQGISTAWKRTAEPSYQACCVAGIYSISINRKRNKRFWSVSAAPAQQCLHSEQNWRHLCIRNDCDCWCAHDLQISHARCGTVDVPHNTRWVGLVWMAPEHFCTVLHTINSDAISPSLLPSPPIFLPPSLPF